MVSLSEVPKGKPKIPNPLPFSLVTFASLNCCSSLPKSPKKNCCCPSTRIVEKIPPCAIIPAQRAPRGRQRRFLKVEVRALQIELHELQEPQRIRVPSRKKNDHADL